MRFFIRRMYSADAGMRPEGPAAATGAYAAPERPFPPAKRNVLYINTFHPRIIISAIGRCEFGTLYGPKYKNNFSSVQAPYNVNSPLSGRPISSIEASTGRFLPSTYMSLVMAASVVMSWADTTPAARRRCPVS